MVFNYRVLKEISATGDPAYDAFKVITVYYDDDQNIVSWSDTSDNTLVWSEYEDLKGTVEYVRAAFDKPVLVADENDILTVLDPQPEANES